MTLDQQIRTELDERGEQWLTWTQLADALRAVLDDCESVANNDRAPGLVKLNAANTVFRIAQELGLIPHGLSPQPTPEQATHDHSGGNTACTCDYGRTEGVDPPGSDLDCPEHGHAWCPHPLCHDRDHLDGIHTDERGRFFTIGADGAPTVGPMVAELNELEHGPNDECDGGPNDPDAPGSWPAGGPAGTILAARITAAEDAGLAEQERNQP